MFAKGRPTEPEGPMGDFITLLDKVRCDEFGFSTGQISDRQLRYFSSSEIAPKRYKTFHIRKKSGGLRDINAPCGQLKFILCVLNKLLSSIYTPNDCVNGFAEGRSVVTNAQRHVGHHYVFNID